MEQQYYTLQTIYNIVKDEAHPHMYLCNTREIIVRQLFGWDDLKTHLDLLAAEELILVRQLDSIAISITPAGLEKAKSLLKMTA
ncbi:MAG: hypothetical protein EOO02_11960 [Chitinophagaceae bacterium]|nr:MAG: hypothetical protein EOO02_11960 [Chitinophagaceae bacterium]